MDSGSLYDNPVQDTEDRHNHEWDSGWDIDIPHAERYDDNTDSGTLNSKLEHPILQEGQAQAQASGARADSPPLLCENVG